MYLVPFLRCLVSNNGVTLTSGLEVVRGHYERGRLTTRKLEYGFLSALYLHSNYGRILYHFRDNARYWSKIAIFGAALVVMRCLSVYVCLSVTFGHSVKTNKHIFNCFISGSQVSPVFPRETPWHYYDGDPLTGRRMQGGMKNDDFRSISRFISKMMQDRAIVATEGK